MKAQNLIEATFSFGDGIVRWQNTGRGTIGGREYPSTYKVTVWKKNLPVETYNTSLQANKSNSIDFLSKKYP